MADQLITKQELIEAQKDVKNAGEAVNTKKVITPRYGDPFKSIPLVVEEGEQKTDAAVAVLNAKANEVVAKGFYTGYATETALKASLPTVSEMRARADDTRKIWRWNRTSAEGVTPVTGTWTDTGPSDVDVAVEQFIEEAQRQGVALDQLEDYYNYLMQQLAQIAINKGWNASFIVSADGSTQQQINDRGGAKWYEKPLGYELNDRVMLANGEVVKNTVENNTKNPNVDMTGWVKTNSAGQIFDASGKSQQVINDRIEIIRDSAVILESYKPAYSTEKLSNRFSTLAEAKAVYPSARNLTDYVDLTVLQQAINDANGRRVITKSGRDLYLNTVGVSPDGHAGEYCLLASNAVELRPDGSTRTKLIVPSNTHGLIGMADDIIVDNMQFYGDAVATSDIGHMIKFVKCKRPRVLNSKFTNVSDVAVNFGYHYTQAAQAMDVAIANGTLNSFDMFQFGSSDFEYIGNVVDDCYGDGGIEVQASVRGKITRNDHRNCRVHGYRIVGCRDTDIYNNHGEDIGTASTFSAMLSLFSGAFTKNGNMAWMYNEDLRVYSNTGDNVKDSIHMGLGGLNQSVFDNEIGAWNRGLYIFHTNPTCRYGLKDSRIYRNKLRSAKGKAQGYGVHLAVGITTAKPLQGALLDNVNITDNDFDFSLKACYTESQTADHKIINSKINNRYYTATSTSVATSATGTTLDFVEATDLSGGSNNIANGTELVVTNPSGSNIYGRKQELKFTRSGDTLVIPSRSDIKTGQLVTLRFTSGSTLPAPLAINTPYYLIVVDTKTVKLATSLVNAFAGTAITLTSDTVLHNFMTFI